MKVPGLIPADLLEEAKEFIYSKLADAELCVDGKWCDVTDVRRQGRVRKFVRSISRSRVVSILPGDQARACAETLCGGQTLQPPKTLSQLLFTAPFSYALSSQPITDWQVPAGVWHTDYPRDGDPASYGLQLFTFVDQVLPQGGGTIVVSGSHRLFEGEVLGSKELKRRLRHSSFWVRLSDKRLPQRSRLEDFSGEVDGVPLQLVELHGNPGDVYFTDLRLLHSLTPNVQSTPRIMITQRLPTESGAIRIQQCLEQLQRRRAS